MVARIARIFLLFAHAFLRAFISFTFNVRIYLTIVLFVVFVPPLFHLQTYSDTIDGNIWSAPFQFFKVCSMTLQLFKVWFLLQNIFHKTHGYLLDRIHWCTCVFLRWVTDFFVFLNTDITITCFHSFFLTCTHSLFSFESNWSIFLTLVIMRTQSLFVLSCFTFQCTCYIDTFQLLLIRWSNSKLDCLIGVFNFGFNCFVDVFCSVNLWFNSLGM